ncbi:MAG: 16S rRNA (cytosine(967)-C(5))-methyltransferase RsmB [Limnohabitans sp.]|nr:16S rRNA (cytosine(967)-C(5))-methyltransferase RsmB [Limnohabitans sp.]
MSNEKNAPLWQQLLLTAQALSDVQKGQSANQVLEKISSPLRPGVQALLFHVLRRLGLAQTLLKKLAKQSPQKPVEALLCTALALACDEKALMYPPHTLVSQTVDAAKKSRLLKNSAPFINACLRRFLLEQDALLKEAHTLLLAQWNHPEWWIHQHQKDYPEQWQDILLANNSPAPMTLRVNTKRMTVNELLKIWLDAGMPSTPVGEFGLVLHQPLPVHQILGFLDGLCSVQDLGAQRAASLLKEQLHQKPIKKWRILDACAAPGGKTAHLLEIMDCEVLALDIDDRRCLKINENLQRLGLQAKVVTADAQDTDVWWDRKLFDAILLDAPCSASGIVRRHPDIRWLRRESDIAALAQQQSRMLESLWPLLAPSGLLLFCTCSVFHAEGQDVVQAFLTHNTQAAILPSPGHLIPKITGARGEVQDNAISDHDGFFYALLQKTD